MFLLHKVIIQPQLCKELSGKSARQSSDSLDPASLPSVSTTQSNHSTSAVSNAELSGTTRTRSSDNFFSQRPCQVILPHKVVIQPELCLMQNLLVQPQQDLPSGSATQSNYPASIVSNAELTGITPTRSSDNLTQRP